MLLSSALALLLQLSGPLAVASGHGFAKQRPLGPASDVLEDEWTLPELRSHVEEALSVMQTNFFETWLGQWPTSIDWTGAVLGTHVAATLRTLTEAYDMETSAPHEPESCTSEQLRLEDFVNTYFAQITTYYFGENAFSIRTQAHDDMLWVVLGWLESIRLVDSHRSPIGGVVSSANSNISQMNGSWHGSLFTPAFAHRARVFYDLVARAWDRDICGGGLTWNPRLEPYKNAVTNTQFISAAVGMYIYHPGDDIGAPFLSPFDRECPHVLADNGNDLPPTTPHDEQYLEIAKEAYTWLQTMNMTNDQDLYVDGFHVRSHQDPDTGRRVWGACDLRDESVYTYNQGVILSGSRQLWEATGNITYLEDAHRLVRDVIAATGFPQKNTDWRGLGYSGVLAEFCDSRSSCGQDAQTFKGIFFHHLALLCEPLPTRRPRVPEKTWIASREQAALHARSCAEYIPWVARNAAAAWATRDGRGVMGAWWGAPSREQGLAHEPLPRELPPGARSWEGKVMHKEKPLEPRAAGREAADWDWNDRGRGRTVESHSGGLAVLRTLYSLRTLYAK